MEDRTYTALENLGQSSEVTYDTPRIQVEDRSAQFPLPYQSPLSRQRSRLKIVLIILTLSLLVSAILIVTVLLLKSSFESMDNQDFKFNRSMLLKYNRTFTLPCVITNGKGKWIIPELQRNERNNIFFLNMTVFN